MPVKQQSNCVFCCSICMIRWTVQSDCCWIQTSTVRWTQRRFRILTTLQLIRNHCWSLSIWSGTGLSTWNSNFLGMSGCHRSLRLIAYSNFSISSGVGRHCKTALRGLVTLLSKVANFWYKNIKFTQWLMGNVYYADLVIFF